MSFGYDAVCFANSGGGGGDGYPPGTVHCNGTPTEIVEVTNPTTGKTWMDRNLGASRAATSSTDEEAYGDLYQWGRGADGHQCRNSNTTSTLSSVDQPGHGDFITSDDYWNLRDPQQYIYNLWQGVNGVNNPCPSGYRIPSEGELIQERESWISDNSAGAFASPLKLPMAGSRRSTSGSLFDVGTKGQYWQKEAEGMGNHIRFSSSLTGHSHKALSGGTSVRCIKD